MLWLPCPLPAQFLPADIGATVAGYQDDFEGGTVAAGWMVRGQNVYAVADGVLHVTSASGDPNHLLFEQPGYDLSVQEVLARLRVVQFGTGDPSRAGVGTVVNTSSSQGINLFFRDEPSPGQRHVEFLDDLRAWGSELPYAWQNATWYWLRLRHEPNAASQGGLSDVFGRIWRADGSEPEPATWQFTYDYTPARGARTGFAGIAAGSSDGVSVFDVDYILIKAAGLPGIVVAPNAFVQEPVMITQPPLDQTVLEGRDATFIVTATGNPQPSYQWRRNGQLIPGATQNFFMLPATVLSDDGALFSVVVENVVSNTTHALVSAEARLTVLPDLEPPELVEVQSLGLSQVQATFSERLAPATAEFPAHYTITFPGGTIAVSAATLDTTGTNVLLDVTPLTEGVLYTLSVNNVTDIAAAANVIAPGASATFGAVSFTESDIGNPMPGTVTTPVPGGLDMTSGGTGIGGASDVFGFNHRSLPGDFDVKVRVAALSPSDPYVQAGLMAREDTGTGARFAGVAASPGLGGVWFQQRTTEGGNAARNGSFPVNYPDTWLRLRRMGNLFTGYAGFDGQHWATLDSATIAMPGTVLVGFALTSHEGTETATAAFRDFAPVTGAGTLDIASDREPLGPSSRRTGLVISELMYHPADRVDGRDLEFVELFNTLNTPEDLSGFRLDGDADYRFPAGTVLPPGGFLVVARSPDDITAVYGLAVVHGPFSSPDSLPNGGGTVKLRNHVGAVLLDASYSDDPPWPAAADGAGHSLVLARPTYGEGEWDAWAASDATGGSPGRLDPITPRPLHRVVINEFLAHTDDPQLDFVELYNPGDETADLGGCHLSDAPDTNRFTFPPDTWLAAGGFLALDQTQLGFALRAAGETLYLRGPGEGRVIDAIRFGGQANGISSGRAPDGTAAIQPLAFPTAGADNAPARASQVMLSEIMYHPVTDDDDQYVELYNRGPGEVDLGNWELSAGVRFRFPPQATLAAGAYLVVARNAVQLRSHYTHLNAGNCLGDFDGRLSRRGERIALTQYDTTLVTNNQGLAELIEIQVAADEVTYNSGGRWPERADGGGSSLERRDLRASGRHAANWAASDETTKAPWTLIEHTGRLDHGTGTPDSLQLLLQGEGECLVDNVEVLDAGGANRIANGTFEGGAGGWVAEGTQSGSGLEPAEGDNSTASFHVRAVRRGDNTVNRIRTALTSPLSSGSTATLRARLRWLGGHPELLLRLRGNHLEAIGRMTVPANLGTPAAPNSRAIPNAAPAIHDVAHRPVLPAANEPVLVTARVEDADGVAQVLLRYRVDPASTTVPVPMVDDGTAGDVRAGDGLYSAWLPGQASGTLVAFHVVATDAAVPAMTGRFPTDAPMRECLVRFGETRPGGTLGTYRLWMTQATFNQWSARHKLDNTPLDVTFAYDDTRVIYNAQALYAGSPYISGGYNNPAGNRCGYTVTCPKDDLFLGVTDLVLDWPGRDSTAVQEQAAYWIADRVGLANNYRRFIRLHVNGVTETQRGSIYEDVQQPGSEVIEEWVPDDPDGQLYKIERWFEFSDGGSLISDPMPTLQVFHTTDLASGETIKKRARYRWNWLPRAVRDSVNDYTNILALVDAVNAVAPEPYTTHTEALVDVEQWMGIFAVEHIVNNFDSYGHNIAKNMYAYKPTRGKWQMHMFDIDWVMLASRALGYDINSSLFEANDPTIRRMYDHPPFRRAYFRTVKRAVDGPLDPAILHPWLDAKFAALQAEGVTRSAGQNLTAPTEVKTWIAGRRAYLLQQLAAVEAPFAITSKGGLDFTTATNLVTMAGTAPIQVRDLYLNGVAHQATWTSVTNWSLRILLEPGANLLTLQGYDPDGVPVAGADDTVTITFNGTAESPLGKVVINEIMPHPPVPAAEFVEVHNTSASTAFSLGGWRLNGADFIFPGGTIIDPGGFVVVARDASAFLATYGGGVALAGVFAGQLDNEGETLSLIRPGATPGNDEVMDVVTYATLPPWPVITWGTGSSLQLIDPTRDNFRVANWAAQPAGAAGSATPGQPNTVQAALPAFPQVWLNELQADNQTGPTDASGDHDPWVELFHAGASVISLEGWHLTDDLGDLTRWAFPAGASLGPGGFATVWIDGEPAESGPGEWHANFRVAAGGGTLALVFPLNTQPAVLDYIHHNAIESDRSIGLFPDGQAGPRRIMVVATPGGANDPGIVPVPVFINEWMADNSGALADPADGDFEDWFELYNAGDETVDLGGYLLTDDPSGGRWPIPSGTLLLAGGFLLVWADEEPGQNQAGTGDIHADFRLGQAGEAIALYTPGNVLVDLVTFEAQSANASEGRWPDGGGSLVPLLTFTPRAANVQEEESFRILGASMTAPGALTLSWSAVPGRGYRVESKERLEDAIWMEEGEVIASGAQAYFTSDVASATRRFYRVSSIPDAP